MSLVIFVKNLTSGGAEKQSVLLAKSLADYKVVHFIIFNSKFQEPKYIKLLAESPSVNIIAFDGNIINRFSKLCKYLKANDIDFIFSYLTGANLIAVLAAKFSKVKFVFTGIRNAYLPPVKLLIDKILCNYFVKSAILNCYSGVGYFKERGFKESRMIVIPNCVENMSTTINSLNNFDKTKIISVGRFVAQKDYFTALEVIASIRKLNSKIHYNIVGYGEQESMIREKIIELNLQDSVSVFIDPNNIPQLLEEADIYLSTSLFEGTSNSIMEAMNANLPIVATNVGDNFKLVVDGYNGYLTRVGDVSQIVDLVLKILSDKYLIRTMGAHSKLHLKENYSITAFRDKYLKLIDDAK